MGLLQSAVGFIALLATAQARIPGMTGFTLTWSDDFTGDTYTAPNATNWITDIGTSYPGGPANWGTGEIQTYTNSTVNLRQTGKGALEIIAYKTGSGKWTSGRIETRRKDFIARPGGAMRIQARMALPNVRQPAGYWPAFWTLGADYRGNYKNWPAVGEFDIMENVNGLNKAFGGLHCGTNPGGACNEPNGIGNSAACTGTRCQGNFHVYTFEVDRTNPNMESLSWYLDGALFHQVTSAQIPATVWAQAVHRPVFILLNLAIGGGFPNGVFGSTTPLATTTSGGVFTVDYVAVFNQ